MIRRSDITVKDELGTLEPGVYITVKDTNGNLAALFNDNGSTLGNPLQSDAVTAVFTYNVQTPGTYIEEFRLSLSESPRKIQAIALSSSGLDGLFVNASLLEVPTGTDIVQTTGYSVLDKGAAVYVYDAAVNAAYVTAHPRSSFISANGRGFRLSTEQDITPQTVSALVDGGDDAPAATAALAVLPASGGSLRVTAQSALASSVIVDSKHNVTLGGSSGSGAGYSQPPTSQWTYSGTGSGRFISARSSNAISLRELGIRYNSGSYTGNLIDFSHDGSAVDAAYGLIERCLVGGIGVATAARLVNLEAAIICSIVDSHLQWGVVGIGGRREIAVGNVPFSNAHVITRCTFDNLTTTAVLNAGESWTVIGNTFEGTNGMPRAYFDDISGASAAITAGLSWIGNWHGDAVNVTDAWFCNGATALRGHLNAGNLYNTNGNTVPAIKLTGPVSGAAILGNNMSSTVHFGAVAHYGVLTAGNFLGTDITNLHSDSDDIFIVANKLDGVLAKSYIRVSTPQEVRFGNRNSPVAGPGSFQFNAPATTDCVLDINGDGTQYRSIKFRTAGAERVRFGLDTSSNLTAICYDSGGGFVGYGLTIVPTTLAVTFGGNVDLASGKVYKVNGTQVVGAQGAAVADPAAITSAAGTNAAAAPTQAEFNALVAEFNKVRTDLASVRTSLVAANARLRAHGLYT